MIFKYLGLLVKISKFLVLHVWWWLVIQWLFCEILVLFSETKTKQTLLGLQFLKRELK